MTSIEFSPEVGKGMKKSGWFLFTSAIHLPILILVYAYTPIPEDSIVRTMMVVYFWVTGVLLVPCALTMGLEIRKLGKDILGEK